MEYEPITEANANEWIAWLEEQERQLNGKQIVPIGNRSAIFNTAEGDLVEAKKLVGTLLATLTSERIIIN